MMPPSEILASPLVQLGFAGFAVLQLAIIVWLIWLGMRFQKCQLKAINEITSALATLTTAINRLREKTVATNARLDAWQPKLRRDT